MITKLLLAAGGDGILLKETTDGRSCLSEACRNGHAAVVEVLLGAGGEALLDRATRDGRSCLRLACERGHVDVVRMLLESLGPTLLHLRPDDGGACLLAACGSGHADVVAALVGAGGGACRQRTWWDRCGGGDSGLGGRAAGRACLRAACEGGHARVVAALLRAGGNGLVKAGGGGGELYVEIARRLGHGEVEALLLAAVAVDRPAPLQDGPRAGL